MMHADGLAAAAQRGHWRPFMPALVFMNVGAGLVIGAPYIVKLFAAVLMGASTEDVGSHVLGGRYYITWGLTWFHIGAGFVLTNCVWGLAACTRWVNWRLRLRYGGVRAGEGLVSAAT